MFVKLEVGTKENLHAAKATIHKFYFMHSLQYEVKIYQITGNDHIPLPSHFDSIQVKYFHLSGELICYSLNFIHLL